MAADLAELGLELWDGTLETTDGLAFVGEKARTLILSPPGRGWLPTGRPAEPHAIQAVVAGGEGGTASLNGGLYRTTSVPVGGAE